MADELDTYIEGLVSKVLDAPEYQDISESDKETARQKLSDHFQNVVMDTMLNRLTDEQSAEIQRLIDSDPDKAEEKMTEFSAGVPGLAQDIEERLNREVEELRKLGRD